MMRRSRSVAILLLLLVSALSSTSEARTFGKKKQGLKGRYVEVEDGVSLADYRGALVILGATELTSDRDRPGDDAFVRTASEENLRFYLESAGLFGEIVSAPPAGGPAGQPMLELKTRLDLRYGSQKLRYWVGFGAGKCKLHIRIDMTDARSGRRLGYFNGYGSGGTWFPDGGVPYMARDDLAENYAKLAEYLLQATRSRPHGTDPGLNR